MSVVYDQMTMGHYGNWPTKEQYEKFKRDTDQYQEHDVISPRHYTDGIETWDYITSHNMDYIQGNIIKYVTRFRKKNGLEDLRKARAYLNKLIEIEESK